MEFKNDLDSMKHLLNVIEEHMKHDLYAVGFIGEALVNVNTFNDYLEMKPQMFQAVNDMKESLEYLLKLSQEEVNKIPTLMPITNQHQQQQQTIQQDEINEVKQGQYSEALGLRYNYDAILNSGKYDIGNNNMKQQTHFDYSQSEYNNTNNNSHKVNENLKNYTTNLSYQNKSYTNNNNYSGILPQQQQQSLPNEMNHYEEQSQLISPIPQSNNYTYGNTNINTNNNNNNNSLIEYPQSQPQQQLTPQYHTISDKTTKQKQKISRVADLIMKINSDDELNDIIVQLFGNNILDELTSSKVSDNLIDNVEKSVAKIESLRENEREDTFIEPSQQPEPIKQHFIGKQPSSHHKTNKTINTTSQSLNSSKIVKSYADELLMSKGLSDKSQTRTITTIRNNNNNNKTQTNVNTTYTGDFNYEKSLRFGKSNSNKKYQNTVVQHQKTFVNYTSPHGHYFDTSLQNGGKSTIPSYMKSRSKSKSKSSIKTFSPVKEYINSSNQIKNNILY